MGTVQQDFTVELVDATSEKPFKRFKDANGNIFYEVEPDADYLVKIQVVGSDVDPSAKFRFDILVDGSSIGYYQTLSKTEGAHFLGVFERRNGVQTGKALRFKSPSDVSYSLTANTPFYGTVETMISEAIQAGYAKVGDIKPPKEAPVVSNCDNFTNKALRSGNGKLMSSSFHGNEEMYTYHYRSGFQLGRIKLNYCTTVGLIKAGILPKPPLWEWHRMLFKRPPCTNEELKRAAPSKKIKIDAVYKEGILITPARELELFDLIDDEEPYKNKPSSSSPKTAVPVTPDNSQSA